MLEHDIKRHVPRFLLNDRNGYALAQAIGAAVEYFNAKVDEGIRCIGDYDTMPEWRLDEMAWEYDALYDYTADVESKRKWIRNATEYYRMYGTVQALYKYLEGYFESLTIEEAAVYGGDPFHFRVIVDGSWTPEDAAWAAKAISEAKNVRSVMDGLGSGSRGLAGVYATGGARWSYAYLRASLILKCGVLDEMQ